MKKQQRFLNRLFLAVFDTHQSKDDVVFKLKSNGVSGKLLNHIKRFLSERYQRVVLNGKSSSWKPVLAGVPQGSVRGALFFFFTSMT